MVVVHKARSGELKPDASECLHGNGPQCRSETQKTLLLVLRDPLLVLAYFFIPPLLSPESPAGTARAEITKL